MTAIVLIVTFVLLCLLSLVSLVQKLYLESARLRGRDVAALHYFKEELQDRLGMSNDRGTLSYSLIKHTILLLTSLSVVAILAVQGFTLGPRIAEAAVAAWFAMILFGYLGPQILYVQTSGRWLEPLIPFIKALALLVRPLVAPLEFLNSLFGDEPEKGNGHDEPDHSVEDIEALITAGAEEGLIEEEDKRLIQSVIAFGDKEVREVMTPRPEIVAIQADASLEDLRMLVVREQFSRIPVYGRSIDDVLGYVHVRDMFQMDYATRALKPVREAMRPLHLVPEMKKASDLLREMQRDNQHISIVVDEYGNTAGLVAMEDLVEVIVGEIRDEHEPDSDVVSDGNGSYVVSGSFDLGRLPELLELHAPEETESTTIGGLVSEWLGHVPAPGEVAEREGLRIEVLASNELRVEQVRLQRVPVEKEAIRQE